ncbi:hypothetical protein [Runella salmonicolor]|uniref:Uncharacterized protein n=1 Tax=Runella salmonicolor TaxID=2950278 RepID=A0ABT1FRR7_9BACT|nr:hypothetical protein [Runella salmonicolor]MCP1384450.1 hypothetical protein [Runella salmonicolor]
MQNQTIPAKRNLDRYIAATGKTEADYQAWASEVGRKMHINNLDKLICAKFNLYSANHLSNILTELPLGIDEKDVEAYILENSVNPLELATLWKEATNEVQSWVCKESTIANSLTFFPKSDFEQFGDRNHLVDVSRRWFKADGLNLDTQAQEMSENSGFEITVQDLIEYVMKYRPGTYKNPAQVKVKLIEERFKAATTFGIKDYYVNHLIKLCRFEEQPTEEVPF